MAQGILMGQSGGGSKITEKPLEALGFTNVPSGTWELKTGTLETSSLDGTTYIPLSSHLNIDYTKWDDTFSSTAVVIVDNLGTQYTNFGCGQGNSDGANARFTANIDMELISTNNFDCSNLLQITEIKPVDTGWITFSSYINLWLEKVS